MSVKLSVSGKIYEVSREVICKSGLFRGMLEDCAIDGEINVLRSSKLFDHVYGYLLDSKYPYPKKYYSELDYYLVDYQMSSLYDSNTIMQREIINAHMSLKYDFFTQISEIKNAESVRSTETTCLCDGCDVVCMVPVCESHRGKCCHTEYVFGDRIANGNFQSCERETDNNSVYCYLHR